MQLLLTFWVTFTFSIILLDGQIICVCKMLADTCQIAAETYIIFNKNLTILITTPLTQMLQNNDCMCFPKLMFSYY